MEANETILGHKRLEKDSLRRARQEVLSRLEAWRLGHTGNLSVTAKPFMPLATSSSTAAASVSTRGLLCLHRLFHPIQVISEVGIPMYTTDDEGMTTDGGAFRTSQRSSRKRG